MERLVEALSHAQHELQLVNGCTVNDAPGESWEVDASPTLDAVREALDEAAAAGFDPGSLRMPKLPGT